MKKLIGVIAFIALVLNLQGSVNAAVNSDNKTDPKTINQKYREYKPYTKKLKNKVLAVNTITKNNIKITRKTLEPKVKVEKKANAYEYIVTNNTGKDIIIKNVASEGFIGLTQIAAYCAIPQPKDFIPIYGLVYGVQTDLEKNKFTRPHPLNETIKKGTSMRILALSKKGDNPVAIFTFQVNNNLITIEHNTTKK